MKFLSPDSRIFVAGHNGLVGRAIVKALHNKGYENVVVRNRADLDLLDKRKVSEFLHDCKPQCVIVAAAKVGGILANDTYRAEFVYQNLEIQNNVIWGSHLAGVERLIFLGSSCIYPRMASQPIKETSLLTGPLEETNRPYAIAKIAGLELVNSIRRQYKRHYFSAMPTNLYGPGDNFDPASSHVLPGLLRRFVEAVDRKSPEIAVWGTGSPRREFLYSEDCAEAITFLAESLAPDYFEANEVQLQKQSHINVGFGSDITIRELAEVIAEKTGYQGKVVFDSSKPDGTPRKLLDSSLLASLGWRPKTSLSAGIDATLKWFQQNHKRGL